MNENNKDEYIFLDTLTFNEVSVIFKRLTAYFERVEFDKPDFHYYKMYLIKIQNLYNNKFFTPRETIFELFFLFFPIKDNNLTEQIIKVVKNAEVEDLVLFDEDSCAVISVFFNQKEISILHEGLADEAGEILFRFNKVFNLTIIDTADNMEMQSISFLEVKKKMLIIFKLIIDFYREKDIYPKVALQRNIYSQAIDCSHYIQSEQVKYAAERIRKNGMLSLEEEQINISNLPELNRVFSTIFSAYIINWLKCSLDVYRAFINTVFFAEIPLSKLHVSILYIVFKSLLPEFE